MADLVFLMNRKEPCTVEEFLCQDCKLSKRQLTKLKHIKNGITIQGKLARSIDIISFGQEIILHFQDNKILQANPNLQIDLIFEDEDLLVFNKPAGMPVHPSQRHYDDTLGNAFASQFPELTFRPVNRLDKDTSGLVAVAKHALSASYLHKNIKKIYYAVVTGNLLDSGVINKPIDRKSNSVIERCIADSGKPAVTHFQTLQRTEKYCFLQLILETGRTHQIRVHMASVGCSLAGDELYGGCMEDINRQALHCGEFHYLDKYKKYHKIIAPIPEDMRILLERKEKE
ncbi:MAG: RluA family pseudouridine synthase [Oscillospiraceae bacterium]|nr:RluA family pseudouridine synthase [Oscillospiraceae bacterium]